MSESHNISMNPKKTGVFGGQKALRSPAGF
jgi:hypothetical protein